MILSWEYLERESKRRNITFSKQTQILNESIEHASLNEKFDIFISHSYKDKLEILTLIQLFSDAGYSAYVDWIEHPQLDRSKVETQTAEILRDDMEKCISLAYVTTNNIYQSQWCPWELGYADGFLNHKCCLLPILREEGKSKFYGHEYLGLYPYIKYLPTQGSEEMDFWVYSPNNDGNYIHLRDWIDEDNPQFHK